MLHFDDDERHFQSFARARVNDYAIACVTDDFKAQTRTRVKGDARGYGFCCEDVVDDDDDHDDDKVIRYRYEWERLRLPLTQTRASNHDLQYL